MTESRVVGSDELNCGSCFEFASMSKRIEGAGKIGSKSKRPFRSCHTGTRLSMAPKTNVSVVEKWSGMEREVQVVVCVVVVVPAVLVAAVCLWCGRTCLKFLTSFHCDS